MPGQIQRVIIIMEIFELKITIWPFFITTRQTAYVVELMEWKLINSLKFA